MTTSRTLGEILHECAGKYADRTCIIQAETGDSLTYVEFDRLVNRLAHGVRAGLPSCNAYVGIMLENSISYLAMTYALKKLDYIEVSINRAFRGVALARMINLTALQVLLTSPVHFDALAAVAPDLPHLTTLVLTDGIDGPVPAFPNGGSSHWQTSRRIMTAT